jgi:hypothetical protein
MDDTVEINITPTQVGLDIQELLEHALRGGGSIISLCDDVEISAVFFNTS